MIRPPKWMRKALDLAEKGRGYTSPNPVVGAVIVKDNLLLGEGWHARFGAAHAEVVALSQAGEAARGAVLYVNLEPCSFYGKTPPCVDAIIQAGIEKVYIGMIDPNPNVNGRGVDKLKAAGIGVEVGILENEARELNKGFNQYIRENRPWVTLKLAVTADGYIADITGKSQWISSPDARAFVMQERTRYDAIMVGIGTVMKDDPSLLPEKQDGYIPYRIVLDDLLNIPYRMKLCSDDFRKRTIVVTTQTNKNKKAGELQNTGITVIPAEPDDFGWIDLSSALRKLAELGITSIYCEGGGQLAGSLMTQKLVDELQYIIAPKIIGEGIFAFSGFMRTLDEAIQFAWQQPVPLGPDVLLRGKLR